MSNVSQGKIDFRDLEPLRTRLELFWGDVLMKFSEQFQGDEGSHPSPAPQGVGEDKRSSLDLAREAGE